MIPGPGVRPVRSSIPYSTRCLEGVQLIDFEFRYAYVNRTAAAHGRRTREELLGRKMADAYPGIEQTGMFATLTRCMVERTPQQMANHFTYPDGRFSWFDLRMNPVPAGVLILSIDISDLKAVEEQARRSEAHLAATLDCMAEGVITADLEARVTGMNPSAQVLTGWSEHEGKGRRLQELVRLLNQDTDRPIDDPVEVILRDGLKLGLANHTVLVARNGVRIPIASSGVPIRHADGTIRGVVLVLKDMKEEYDLAAMFQQAQKMESLGLLAGGVAHDFNNLLTVISGYAEVALRHAEAGSKLHDQLQQILRAGDRARALTRQLLAVGRKQVLQPRVLDVNETVGNLEKMLRRLIGENVEFVTRLAPDLDRVLFDPGQIDQILMNLAVNARDAMPDGGTLILETANVELGPDYVRLHEAARPGPHVMIAVSDTGTGMDAETRSRIFDPFFTTKEAGKGTGLGLSTVYGIVKQGGGNIWVYSEPGRGTSFKIYLPRTEAQPDAPEGATGAETAGPVGGTVLVVEDEKAVLRLLELVLKENGFTVHSADTPEAAVEACRRHPEIDLLLTDVVLQRSDGKRLAAELVSLRPGLKVVFMSGYTDGVLAHNGVLEPGIDFLQKPIGAEALLTKIRAVLATGS